MPRSVKHDSILALVDVKHDMENWNYATLASKGVIARRYPYNYYQMGLGQDYGTYDSPGVLTDRIAEQNKRGFYERWAAYMDGARTEPRNGRRNDGRATRKSARPGAHRPESRGKSPDADGRSLTPTATDTAEGMARAAEWGVPFRRPSNPSPRRRGFLGPGVPGVPLGRLPSPTDYANAAVFLASDDAAMITGADLKVDAGALARYWRWDPSASPPA